MAGIIIKNDTSQQVIIVGNKITNNKNNSCIEIAKPGEV